ncbi:MAG: hypothetical protein ACYC65_13055 [Candidatus Limnocylindrales bacterium]
MLGNTVVRAATGAFLAVVLVGAGAAGATLVSAPRDAYAVTAAPVSAVTPATVAPATYAPDHMAQPAPVMTPQPTARATARPTAAPERHTATVRATNHPMATAHPRSTTQPTSTQTHHASNWSSHDGDHHGDCGW